VNLLITICARGGSKGIPGKNVKLLNGKPLLHYTLGLAQRFAKEHDADVVLSTDADYIKECAAELNYKTTYTRPDWLANDTAGKVDAIRDAWQFAKKRYQKEYDFVLDMDVTSPLRTLDDLNKAYRDIKQHPEALNIFSVNDAQRNPYFNMVEKHDDGFVRVVKKAEMVKSRQKAPPVYDMNASFYFFTREFMEEGIETSTTERSLAYVMPHICFDLDEPVDFTVLSLMMENNLLDFEL
jgi:CMP-N-acetylneuraminic acid synthetase